MGYTREAQQRLRSTDAGAGIWHTTRARAVQRLRLRWQKPGWGVTPYQGEGSTTTALTLARAAMRTLIKWHRTDWSSV
jgi:hypothetical protein